MAHAGVVAVKRVQAHAESEHAWNRATAPVRIQGRKQTRQGGPLFANTHCTEPGTGFDFARMTP
jgi:hypothetical protein